MKIPFVRAHRNKIQIASPAHSRPLLNTPPLRVRLVADKPSFDHPISQLVSAEQILSPRFVQWCRLFGWKLGLNRKLWEYLYILNAMDQLVGLHPGTRVLGFGVGRERIVPLLASLGCDVVATDYLGQHELWPRAAQNLEDLFDSLFCDAETFHSRVSFQNVDMNRIPPNLREFDCLWSCGSLEHIGGLQNGLDFIEAAMECLRPGGAAIHTTEFNLVSDEITYETPSMSFYRRRDIIALAERLLEKGHQIVLNFTRGDTLADLHVDQDPARNIALSLTVQADIYIITSIGLIIQKRREAGSSVISSNEHARIAVEATSLWLLPSFSNILGADGIIYYDVSKHGNAADTTICYGPYTTLASGTYRVTIGREIIGTFKVRFTDDFGKLILHEQAISSADDLITFVTLTPVRKFEVVVRGTETSERLLLDRIILERT
jgi:hypothetical protein